VQVSDDFDLEEDFDRCKAYMQLHNYVLEFEKKMGESLKDFPEMGLPLATHLLEVASRWVKEAPQVKKYPSLADCEAEFFQRILRETTA
jgi:hypothetical protein